MSKWTVPQIVPGTVCEHSMNVSCFIALSTEHAAAWFSSDREMGESVPSALLASSVVSDGSLLTNPFSQGFLEPPRKDRTPRVNSRNEASTNRGPREAGRARPSGTQDSVAL